MEIRDLTPETAGQGHRRVWVMEDANNGNERMEITSDVTGYEPYRRIDVKLSSPEAFTGQVSYIFQDLGGGRTALTQSGTYHLTNWMARLMIPW